MFSCFFLREFVCYKWKKMLWMSSTSPPPSQSCMSTIECPLPPTHPPLTPLKREWLIVVKVSLVIHKFDTEIAGWVLVRISARSGVPYHSPPPPPCFCDLECSWRVEQAWFKRGHAFASNAATWGMLKTYTCLTLQSSWVYFLVVKRVRWVVDNSLVRYSAW